MHGDYVTYSKGCRCDSCRAAWREWERAYSARNRPAEPQEVTQLRELAYALGYSISKIKHPALERP